MTENSKQPNLLQKISPELAEAISSTIERMKEKPESCVRFGVFFDSFSALLHQPQTKNSMSATLDATFELWEIHKVYCPENNPTISSHTQG
ncbi:MAG: hypothetical protein U1C50_00410 [Patescibacteria group bacterium]|nr:hypothetical protein [Candidatus Beckwithbacteria bacterium]MDZ4228697.1 hypothetical protein [Patescibacteria group bacterium]